MSDVTASAGAKAADDNWPRPAYAWYVLIILSLGYIFAFVDRIILGLLTPAIQADLRLTDTQLGLLQGIAFALFYTLFGLPLGWAVDRFRRVGLLATGIAVWSSMTAFCGMATSFWPLFLARMGVGVGEATLNPCATSLIADLFKPSKRAKAFGFYVMSTALATGITYLITGILMKKLNAHGVFHLPLLGEVKPWQMTFLIVGAAGLIPTLLLFFTVKEPHRHGVAKKAGASRAQTWAFLKQNAKTLFCLLVGVALIVLEVYSVLYWQPTLFLRKYDWKPEDTAIWLAMLGAPMGVMSAIGSGFLTDWLKRKGRPEGAYLTCLIGAVGCTIFGGLAPLMPTPWLCLAFFSIRSLFINFPTAACLTAIAEVTPNQYRGQVTALYVIMTGLFAQGLGPVALGFANDTVFRSHTGIAYSMSTLVLITGVLGSALLIWGRSAYRKSMLPETAA